MYNADFSFLGDENKIKEANKLNDEFENFYMACDEFSYDDCIFLIRLKYMYSLKYLTKEEYIKIEKMF
jgi:hypothetical protein